MPTPFLPVPDEHALEQLVARSHAEPMLLFKHDPFCGISAAAHREMATVDGGVHVVDVARQHGLSRLLTLRAGVRHESPQVLLLRGGTAVWSASHRAITADAVARALREPAVLTG